LMGTAKSKHMLRAYSWFRLLPFLWHQAYGLFSYYKSRIKEPPPPLFHEERNVQFYFVTVTVGNK
jgi:hypothetical protein